jgi:hypothetical protein
MKIKSRKLLSLLLTLVMVFSLFAAMPLAASAATASQLKDIINSFDPGPSSMGKLEAYTISGRPVVIIGGTVTGATNTLILDIDSGLTVQWVADYSGSMDDGVIQLTGSGTFEVTGGSISNDKNTTISLLGLSNVAVKVSGGTVRNTGSNSGTAISGSVTSNNNITVSGGTVSSIRGYAISVSGHVTVSGGTVSRAGGDRAAIEVFNQLNTVTVTGGIISAADAPAIYCDTSSSVVNISGNSLVFSYGTNITGNNNSIIRGTATISGDAVVCGWNKAAGTTTYTDGTATDLVAYSGATVKWVKSGAQSGISYAKGANTGFFQIDGVTVGAEALSAPSNLTATAGADGITLNWTNNAATGDKIYIDRKEGSGIWVTIADSPATLTTYTDASVEMGKTYTYKIRVVADFIVSNFSNEATATMGGAPTITGPTTMTLTAGYAATSTGAYTITGTPAPTVTKTSGNDAISWNNSAKKLEIGTGLAAGTYTVVLKAANGVMPDATLTFTLTVKAADSASSMSNFAKKRTYTRGMFTDVNETLWYGFDQQKSIANAYEYGLMDGVGGGKFSPIGNMRISEALAIAARVHNIYNGGTGEFTQGPVWYQIYVDYCIEKGIITATTFNDYTRNATRAEMAYIFSRCLPIAEFPSQNTVNSLPDVNDGTPYRGSIIMLYEAGVLEGSGATGTFNPMSPITRAEASAIITRVILPAERKTGRTFG